MKKFAFKIVALVLFSGMMVSCDEDIVQNDADGSNTLAGFVNSSGTLPVFEDGVFSYDVEVGVSTKSDVNRTIDLDINTALTTALPAEYTIDAATYIVPAGSFVGKIKVTGHFNGLTPLVTKFLVFDLSGVDGAHISNENKRFSLALFQACPFAIEDFVGTYDAIRDNNPSLQYEVVVTLGTEPNQLVLKNIHGSYPSSMTKITLNGNLGNPLISYPAWQTNFIYTHPTYGAVGLDPNPNVPSKFDTCGLTMTLNYRLRVSAGTFAPNVVKLTKQVD